MKKDKINKGEIVIYKSSDGPKLEIKLDKKTVWLTQEQISLLFNKNRSVITRHINNIFKSGELNKKSNVQKMHFPHSDKKVGLYSLDVIISVGYRVNSKRATQFRIWATKTLKKYLIDGYIVNRKRLLETTNKLDKLQQTIKYLANKSKNDFKS